MKEPISFNKIKLSSHPLIEDTTYLKLFHKYEPELHIWKDYSEACKVVRFPIAQFITVTDYRNEEVKNLKAKHNPHLAAAYARSEKNDSSSFCIDCGISFETPELLIDHKKAKAEEKTKKETDAKVEESKPCHICHASLSNEQALLYHLQIVHGASSAPMNMIKVNLPTENMPGLTPNMSTYVLSTPKSLPINMSKDNMPSPSSTPVNMTKTNLSTSSMSTPNLPVMDMLTPNLPARSLQMTNISSSIRPNMPSSNTLTLNLPSTNMSTPNLEAANMSMLNLPTTSNMPPPNLPTSNMSSPNLPTSIMSTPTLPAENVSNHNMSTLNQSELMPTPLTPINSPREPDTNKSSNDDKNANFAKSNDKENFGTDNSFNCHVCGRSFRSDDIFKDHICTVDFSSETSKCLILRLKTPSHEYFLKCRVLSDNEKMYRCCCEKFDGNLDELKTHIFLDHNGKKN